MLAFRPQCLPAGCENVRPPRPADDLFSQGGGSFDHVLAAVEHDEHAPLLEECDQARQGSLGVYAEAQLGRERTRHEQRVGQRCKIDEVGAVWEVAENLVG